MWYRLILSAIRNVGRGGERTFHKTKVKNIRNPSFTMMGIEGEKDPSSSVGLGSKVEGEGHYTSQNPVVSFGYKMPYSRVEKLPYGARIFDYNDIPPDVFNKILEILGSDKRVTANQSMKDLKMMGYPVQKINPIILSLGFDAIEYDAFRLTDENLGGVSKDVLDLLVDYFINHGKLYLKDDDYDDTRYLGKDEIIKYLYENIDKIKDKKDKDEIERSYQANNLQIPVQGKFDYRKDVLEAYKSIKRNYSMLKDNIQAYYDSIGSKKNITEKKINRSLRDITKRNLLIINSVALTNPRLFQKEKFRPELLTDEEKEYLRNKKYSTSYDVTKDLIATAKRNYGENWLKDSGLKFKVADFIKLTNDGIISSDEFDSEGLRDIGVDDFFVLLEYDKIPIEKYINKINSSSFHMNLKKIWEKLMNLQDKELAKKVIPLLIDRRLLKACDIDTGIKLINMGLIDKDTLLKLSSGMFISNFNQLEDLIGFGISYDVIDYTYNWNDYQINENADKYKSIGVSQHSILRVIDIRDVSKLLKYGFDPNIITIYAGNFMEDMDDYQKMLLIYSNVYNLLKAGANEDDILNSFGIKMQYGNYKYIDLKLNLYKQLSSIISNKDLLFEKIFNPDQRQIAYSTLSYMNEQSDKKIELPNVDFDIAGYENLRIALKKMDHWLENSLLCPRCENILFQDYDDLRCSVCVKVISYASMSFSTNLRHETKPAMLNDLIPILVIVRSNPDLWNYVENLLSLVNKNMKQTLSSTYYGMEDKYIFKPFYENELIRAFLPIFYETYDYIYPLLKEPDVTPDVTPDSDSDEDDYYIPLFEDTDEAEQ